MCYYHIILSFFIAISKTLSCLVPHASDCTEYKSVILLFRDFPLSWLFFVLLQVGFWSNYCNKFLAPHLKNDKEIIAWEDLPMVFTAQKMKFSIKDFFSKLRIWSHLLKKSLMENFHFLCGAWGTKYEPLELHQTVYIM